MLEVGRGWWGESVWLGIDPGYIRLPQSEKKYCIVIGVLLVCEKEKNSSSAPGLSVMTPREGRVDRPFPSHMTRCWVRTSPPPQYGHGPPI